MSTQKWIIHNFLIAYIIFCYLHGYPMSGSGSEDPCHHKSCFFSFTIVLLFTIIFNYFILNKFTLEPWLLLAVIIIILIDLWVRSSQHYTLAIRNLDYCTIVYFFIRFQSFQLQLWRYASDPRSDECTDWGKPALRFDSERLTFLLWARLELN